MRCSFWLDQVAVVFRDLVEFVHCFSCFIEQFVNFVALFGGSLDEEGSLDGLHKFHCVFSLNFTFKVTFGANEKNKSGGAPLLVKLFQPLLQAVETFAVVDGVDQEDGSCSAIEVVGDGLVNILSALYEWKWYCIPDLQLDGLFLDQDGFG